MSQLTQEIEEIYVPHPLLVVASALIQTSPRYRNFDGNILGMLHDDSKGYHLARLNTEYGGSETLQANHISYSDWRMLRRFTEIAEEHSDWAEEGWEFLFQLTDLTIDLTLPDCDAGPYIGTNISVDGNMFDSNADTWASQMGNKAQRLYLFYLPDLKKYGVVYASYWLL